MKVASVKKLGRGSEQLSVSLPILKQLSQAVLLHDHCARMSAPCAAWIAWLFDYHVQQQTTRWRTHTHQRGCRLLRARPDHLQPWAPLCFATQECSKPCRAHRSHSESNQVSHSLHRWLHGVMTEVDIPRGPPLVILPQTIPHSRRFRGSPMPGRRQAAKAEPGGCVAWCLRPSCFPFLHSLGHPPPLSQGELPEQTQPRFLRPPAPAAPRRRSRSPCWPRWTATPASARDPGGSAAP
mmetsp:Transcript_11724/g.22284  ORF Transcript_11724/g.22284 Transcript_11724/m.22284 type:complete len:238 (-) Transcript_11724:1796-2509(-)